jgi:uncharacterized membrane protein YoaK (UPF0700 family)
MYSKGGRVLAYVRNSGSSFLTINSFGAVREFGKSEAPLIFKKPSLNPLTSLLSQYVRQKDRQTGRTMIRTVLVGISTCLGAIGCFTTSLDVRLISNN